MVRSNLSLWDEFVLFAKQKFSYLETRFGFRLLPIDSNTNMIVYESDLLSIYINWLNDDWGDKELSLGFSPLNGEGWDIGSLMALHNSEYSSGYRHAQTKEGLAKQVQKLADLLLEYGSDTLNGNFTDFGALDELADDMIRNQHNFRSHKELSDFMYEKHSKEHLRQYHNLSFFRKLLSKVKSTLSRVKS